MKLYLIRHGKSKAHEESRRQSPGSPLGRDGIKQVEYLANRIKNENEIGHFLSSHLKRARQTSDILAKLLKKEVTILEGSHELERNPELYGILENSAIALKFLEEVKKHGKDLDWKFEGEGESIRELTARVIRVKNNLLKQFAGKSVVLITHGIFIRCFLTIAILGDEYDDKQFFKLFESFSFDNAGVSKLEYFQEKGKWKIEYINDTSHLKEK